MDRRGFLGQLATGLIVAPLAAVGLAKVAKEPIEDVWSMHSQWVPKEAFLESYPTATAQTTAQTKVWLLNTDYMTFNGKQIKWDPPTFELPRKRRR